MKKLPLNAFQLEKNVYSALSRRYGFSLSDRYLFQAWKSYLNRSSFVKTREVYQSMNRANILLLGDDRLVESHRDQIKLLVARLSWDFGNTVVLTDRNHVDTISYFKGKAAQVLRLKMKGTLAKRDRELAEKVQKLCQSGKRVIAWVGALRVAPDMLPKKLAKSSQTFCSISLGAPPARWKKKVSKGFLQYQQGTFCWISPSPIYALEMFRAWSLKEHEHIEPEHVEHFFESVLSKISQTAKVGKPRQKPKIVHPV